MKKPNFILKVLVVTIFLTILPYRVVLTLQDPTPFDTDHTQFDKLLKKYVNNAKVDYKGFIKSRDEFESYLKSLGDVPEVEYNGWSEKQKLSFWINAYNAFTIKAIIDHYPIKRSWTLIGIFYAPKNSILQIPGVWKKLKFKAVGKTITLDHIEHQILRKEFNEPRIHVAINCASIGCPDLRIEAYTAFNLEKQLNDASISFVNNSEKGLRLSEEGKRIRLSKIFKWFGRDFLEVYGNEENFSNRSLNNKGVLGFVLNYLQSEKHKEILKNNDFKISYLKYDWSLNEQS